MQAHARTQTLFNDDQLLPCGNEAHPAPEARTHIVPEQSTNQSRAMRTTTFCVAAGAAAGAGRGTTAGAGAGAAAAGKPPLGNATNRKMSSDRLKNEFLSKSKYKPNGVCLMMGNKFVQRVELHNPKKIFPGVITENLKVLNVRAAGTVCSANK